MPASRNGGVRRLKKRCGDAEVQFLRSGFSLGGRTRWEGMEHRTFTTETIELSDGTTREVMVAHSEFTPKAVSEMRGSYEVLRGEVNDGYTDQHPGRRPFAWWMFDSPEPRDTRLGEVGQLDRMRLLPEGEANRLRLTAHGVRNEFYAPPFRRKRAWWRFLSEKPWRCNGPTEVEQLIAQPAVLTGRENSIWRSKHDVEHADQARLTDLTENELLQLGVELVEPAYEHGCRPIETSLRK